MKDLLSLLKDGSHGTHKSVSEGAYLLSAKNIKNGKVNIDPTDRLISFEDYHTLHKNFSLQEGDVLLTIVGTIGEVAVLKNIKNITFQRSVAFLRCNTLICNYFLAFAISHCQFQSQLRRGTVVSAQPGIYLDTLKNLCVIAPVNKEEQDKIVDMLICLDRIITLHHHKL